MPLFFIDTSDERTFVRGETGIEFADVEAARAAVVAALPEMAGATFRSGDASTFSAVVRDDLGNTLFRASLSLTVTWTA